MSRTGGGGFQQGAGHGPSFVQDLTVRGDLHVDGQAVFAHTDSHTIAGNTTIDGTLGVTGDTALAGGLNVAGNLLVSGTTTTLDTATVTVEDPFVHLGSGTEATEGGVTLANTVRNGRVSVHSDASSFGTNGVSIIVPGLETQHLGILVGTPLRSVNLRVGNALSANNATFTVDQDLARNSADVAFGSVYSTGDMDCRGHLYANGGNFTVAASAVETVSTYYASDGPAASHRADYIVGAGATTVVTVVNSGSDGDPVHTGRHWVKAGDVLISPDGSTTAPVSLVLGQSGHTGMQAIGFVDGVNYGASLTYTPDASSAGTGLLTTNGRQTVTGAATFSNGLTVNTLATNINAGLAVLGMSTHAGGLTVSGGTANLNAGLAVTGAATVSTDLTVSGVVTLKQAIGDITASGLWTDGAVKGKYWIGADQMAHLMFSVDTVSVATYNPNNNVNVYSGVAANATGSQAAAAQNCFARAGADWHSAIAIPYGGTVSVLLTNAWPAGTAINGLIGHVSWLVA